MTLAHIKRIGFVLLGATITAFGLQFFLLPNHLLDGGVTGMSIIASHITHTPLGLWLILLNMPFVWLGYKRFGIEFTVYSLFGISLLALLTSLHFPRGFTEVPVLAAVFGGLFVGIGIGTVVRYGGILDGTDTVAVLIDRVTVFSVGEAVMVINGTIILIAGFVFGWNEAMYSLIAYFVAYKAINLTVDGLNESRSVWVVSMHIRKVGHVVNLVANEPVTYVRESNPRAREPHGMLLAVVTRFEEQRVKAAIREVDPYAFIVVARAHEVVGKLSEDSLHRASAEHAA